MTRKGEKRHYGYDPVGNRLATVLPNGSTASYAYDSLNRLVALQNRAQDLSAISSFDYTLSPTGNRVRVVEGSGRRVDYTYDALLRLTGEQIVDPAGGSATTYTYDAVGNRRSKSSDLTGLLVYVYDANDRLLSEGATTYSYDANGNLLTKSMGGATAIPEYDSRRRLIPLTDGANVTRYTYDVDGNRVRSVSNDSAATAFLVDTNRAIAQVVLETDEAGAPRVTYVHGDDPISQTRNGSRTYYHYDGHASTRQLSDAAGTVTDTVRLRRVRRTMRRAGSTPNQHLYTGEFLDPQSGYYYLRARWLAAAQGRFATEDPVNGFVFDPQTLHKYVYALNNPMNRLDPSGMFSLAEASVTVSISSVLSSIALTHFTFFAMQVKIIDGLIEPGVQMRYGALQILGPPPIPLSSVRRFSFTITGTS